MKITIADLDRSDFPVIRDWIDTDLFGVFHAPIGDDQLEVLLTRSRAGKLTDIGFKAVDDDTGEAIGLTHIVLDWTNELAHIQQMLVGRPELRRRGTGSAMMRHALAVCFDRHGLHRVQLFTDEDNEAALSFYRKHGFHTDGFMREARKVNDRFVGWYCLSMLASEWSDLKGDEGPAEE